MRLGPWIALVVLAAPAHAFAIEPGAHVSIDPTETATHTVDPDAIATSSTSPRFKQPLIALEGNLVLNDRIYEVIADLPPRARATSANARLAQRRILRFLRRAGYELATVTASVSGDRIHVKIDEGKLEKVVILGEGVFETLQLKIAVDLPYEVFNRALLDRQLDEAKDKLHIKKWRWEIVPTEQRDQVGPIIPIPEPFADLPALQPGKPYELRIMVERDLWVRGLAPEAAFNSLYGLALGAAYKSSELLFDDDRWQANARVGVALRKPIDPDLATRPVLSQAQISAAWLTPPIIGEDFRASLGIATALEHNQREDLMLESYYAFQVETALELQYLFMPESLLGASVGVEERNTFGFRPVEGMESPFSNEVRTRAFSGLRLFLTFDPSELRRDRQHFVTVDFRYFRRMESPDQNHTLRLYAEWRKTEMIGWHELRFVSKGFVLAGDHLFTEEASAGGDNLRGPFGNIYYTRKYLGFDAEFRVSVSRDFVKLGIFHDVVVFEKLEPTRMDPSFGLANAFGISLHVLILDAFQTDTNFGMGFSSEGRFDAGLSVSVRLAY